MAKGQSEEYQEEKQEEKNGHNHGPSKVKELLEIVALGTAVGDSYPVTTYGMSEPFRSLDGVGFVRTEINGAKRVFEIQSKEYKQHLRRMYWDVKTDSISPTQLKEVADTLEAVACDPTNEVEPVYRRIAYHMDKDKGEMIYVDLCNDQNEVVAISKDGWQVCENPPVHFVRSARMHPLPHPKRGGTLHDFRQLLNLGDDEVNWLNIMGWLLGAYRPHDPTNPTGSYALLGLIGQSGATKTTIERWLVYLLDPTSTGVRKPPKSEEAITIAANNCYVVAYNNLSSIPQWLSDALCNLADGTGDTRRTLFENSDETSFYAARPIVLTSIEMIVTAEDLLSRTLVVKLVPPPKGKYKAEKKLNQEFTQARPRILGAIYDALSMALRRYEDVVIAEPSRLADFEQWVTACEECFTNKGEFSNALRVKEEEAAETVTSELIPHTIMRFMKRRNGEEYKGTTGTLYDDLTGILEEKEQKNPRLWPQDSAQFGRKISRYMNSLEKVGIKIVRTGHGREGRSITITDTRTPPGFGGNLHNAKQTAYENAQKAKHAAQYSNNHKTPTSDSPLSFDDV